MEYGSGVTAYFKGLKLLTWALCFMTLAYIPTLIINVNGRGTLSQLSSLTLVATTLGNTGFLGYLSGNSTHVNIPGWSMISNSPMTATSASLIYSSCDVATSLIFLVAIIWMRYGEQHEDREVDEATVTADDYTVYLPHTPPCTTEADIREHFSALTRNERSYSGIPSDAWAIEEVHLAREDANLVATLMERGRMSRKIDRLRASIKEQEAIENSGKSLFLASCSRVDIRMKLFSSQLKAAEKAYKKIDSQASKESKSNVTVAAFVTFRYEEAKKRIVEKYNGGLLYWACQPRAHRLKTSGSPLPHRLTLIPAPNPDSVIWENLSVTFWQRLRRTTTSSLLSATLLCISFTLIWFTSWSTTLVYAGPTTDCIDVPTVPQLKNSSLVEFYHTSINADNITKYCSCETQGWSTASAHTLVSKTFESTGLFDASDCPYQSCPRWLLVDSQGAWGKSFCRTWLTYRTVAIALTFASSTLLLAVNMGLSSFMRYFTKWEGHHSFEDLNASLVTRIFFVTFTNTALLTVLINVQWPDSTANSFSTGRYMDFSPSWYSNVGTQIMVTMLVNVFSPHLYLISMALLACCRWRCLRVSKFSTQAQLYKHILGPHVDPALRLAQVYTTLFVCLAFSTGMPALIPIALASMLLFYWVDKCLFMWYYRRPPAYNTALQGTMTSLLPYALLIHLGIGLWMLTGSAGFYNESSSSTSSLISTLNAVNISGGLSRVARTGVLPLFIFFLAVAGWLVTQAFFKGFYGAICSLFHGLTCGLSHGCCSGIRSRWKKKAITFPQSLLPENRFKPGVGMVGTPGFNILLNLEIVRAFNLPGDFALTHSTIKEALRYKHLTRKGEMVDTSAMHGTLNPLLSSHPSPPSRKKALLESQKKTVDESTRSNAKRKKGDLAGVSRIQDSQKSNKDREGKEQGPGTPPPESVDDLSREDEERASASTPPLSGVELEETSDMFDFDDIDDEMCYQAAEKEAMDLDCDGSSVGLPPSVGAKHALSSQAAGLQLRYGGGSLRGNFAPGKLSKSGKFSERRLGV